MQQILEVTKNENCFGKEKCSKLERNFSFPAINTNIFNPASGGPINHPAQHLPVYSAIPFGNYINPGLANQGSFYQGLGDRGFVNSAFVNPGVTYQGLVDPGLLDPYARTIKGSVTIPFASFFNPANENFDGSVFEDYPTSPFYGSTLRRVNPTG